MFELDENGKVKPDGRGFNPVVHGGRSVAVPGEVAGLLAALANFPASENIFLDDGFPKEPGSMLRNPDLANTLRLVAEQGRDAFYQGPVAQSIVDAVQSDGGLMTMEDLADFKAICTRPVCPNRYEQCHEPTRQWCPVDR